MSNDTKKIDETKEEDIVVLIKLMVKMMAQMADVQVAAMSALKKLATQIQPQPVVITKESIHPNLIDAGSQDREKVYPTTRLESSGSCAGLSQDNTHGSTGNIHESIGTTHGNKVQTDGKHTGKVLTTNGTIDVQYQNFASTGIFDNCGDLVRISQHPLFILKLQKKTQDLKN